MLSQIERWLKLARMFELLNTQELPGDKHNPFIVTCLRDFTQLSTAQSDEIPWCSAFACMCMELSGVKSPHHALAKSWRAWGLDTPPRLGAVVVLSEPDHVGFLVGWTDSTVTLLGGNQSNRVRTSTYDRKRVFSMRWPNA